MPDQNALKADSSVAPESERNFLVALTIWGGMFITGLHLLGESETRSPTWWYGAFYMVVGGIGAVSVTPLFKNKFPATIRAMSAPRSLWAAAIATWLLLGADLGLSIYDHFWPHPFTIGVSPIGGPAVAPAPAEPNVPRVYTAKTIIQLIDVCQNRTALQCDEFMADEKGKWINIDGKVQSIFAKGEDTGLMFANEPIGYLATCDFGKKWRDRLNTLRPYESVKVTGKIGPTQVGNPITLQECELRD